GVADYVLFDRVGADAGAGLLAVGSAGDIWWTDPSGSTWSEQDSGTTSRLNDGVGSFTTQNEDYLVGDGGLILRSVDDGETWVPMPSGTTQNLHAIELMPGNGW